MQRNALLLYLYIMQNRYLRPFFLLIILLSFNSRSDAQAELFFPTGYNFYLDTNTRELHTILIDSAFELPSSVNDSVFHFYKVIIDSAGLPGTCTHTTRGHGFFGDSAIRKFSEGQGKFWFFNEDGDTVQILTRAAPGTKFEVMKLSAKQSISAEIWKRDNYTFLDEYDFSRYILFRALDSNYVSIDSHPIANKIIHYTGRYGYASTMRWYGFPNDLQIYHLIGVSKNKLGVQHMDAADAFSYVPGDEFHYIEKFKTDIGAGDHKDSTIYFKLFTLTRDTAASADTIHFSYMRIAKIYTFNSKTSAVDSAEIIDTIYETVILKDFDYLDVYNRQLIAYKTWVGYNLAYLNDAVTPRTINRIHAGFIHDNINNCLKPDPTFNEFDTMEFGSGMGLTKLVNNDGGNEYSKVMVYYRKGPEQHGEEIDFSLLSPTGIEELDPAEIGLFPNPTSGSIRITWPGDMDFQQVEVIDMLGRTIHSQGLDTDNVDLDLNGLSQGYYLVRLIGPKGAVAKSFIKE